VQPTPTGKRGSLGAAIIYFGGPKRSEMNIVVTWKNRQWWKQIYSLVAVGVLCSLIAAFIYSWMMSRR